MRRRDFIALLGGVATALPAVARAQRPPTVGFLSGGASGPFATYVAAFRKGLAEIGFDEKNVAIEYRWADGRPDRLQAMAADLVRSQVDVIFAGGTREALVAKAAISTLPIVFSGGSDPVKLGLVASINRPGGNVTGTTMLAHFSGAKRLEIFRQLLPRLANVAVLLNPENPSAAENLKEIQSAALAVGLRTEILNVTRDTDFDPAFATAIKQGATALIATGDPLFGSRRHRLAELEAKYALPSMYTLRDYVVAGSLMSYGASFADTYRQAGIYVGRILRGAKPADLPVLLPTKFEFVINLKTAKALGLTMPATLLALADEVIE